MMVNMQSRHVLDFSCLVSARNWRQEAAHLREHADRPHLSPMQRATFLRQAEAAERQADWWLEEMEAPVEPTRIKKLVRTSIGLNQTRKKQGRQVIDRKGLYCLSKMLH